MEKSETCDWSARILHAGSHKSSKLKLYMLYLIRFLICNYQTNVTRNQWAPLLMPMLMWSQKQSAANPLFPHIWTSVRKRLSLLKINELHIYEISFFCCFFLIFFIFSGNKWADSFMQQYQTDRLKDKCSVWSWAKGCSYICFWK